MRNAFIILVTLILTNIYVSHLHISALDNYNVPDEGISLKAIVDKGLTVEEAGNRLQEDCELLPENKGPVPVILFAFGRSGSSVTWNVMSNLTGHENIANEEVKRNDQFRKEIVNDSTVTLDWTRDTLCTVQNQQQAEIENGTGKNGYGIAGFQWKPCPLSIKHQYGHHSLQWIAQQQKRNPSVRVVVLTRNFLDKKYSNLKHELSREKDGEHKIAPHCEVGDEECIKMHFEVERALLFPTGRDLLQELDEDLQNHKNLLAVLQRHNIEYVKVTYEKLYNSQSVEEWMRIFKHLGRGPSVGLTMTEVTRAMGLARTSQGKKSKLVRNYKSVRKTLKGTKYEGLLSTWM